MLNFPYKDNRNYEWRAISKDLTISLVAVVVIVSILFSSLTYFIVSKKAKFQLDEKADDYISYLVDSLEMPLWNIDEEGVIKVGESYINNELVARLRITESIDNVIFDRTKEDKRNLINRSGEVTHNNKIVGHIELALTPRIYMENNRKLLWSSLITMLVIVVVLVGATGLLLRVFLRKPLDLLIEGIDRIAGGDYEYKIHGIKQKEIKMIISRFNYMAEQVKRREQSLNDVNRQLEEEISDHKRTENALMESEDRYRILADHVADGVILIQNRRLLFLNDAFASMLGYTDPEELIDKDAVDFISESFKAPFQKMCKELQEDISGESVFQALWLSRYGKELWGEGHHNVIKWKGKPAVLGTVRDITETKLREMAMEEETVQLRRQNLEFKTSLKDRYKFRSIVGKSPAMQQIYEVIIRTAATSANVIIYGESGTGKELVARAIHDTSSRRNNAFIPVNCGAIPENLIESEFFGHRKGAFTDAHKDMPGYLDTADGGTLFLDEVGDLDIKIQVKLLRAIEGGGYTPVGSAETKNCDIRIIAATHKNLVENVKKKQMREDFFYRIHIIPITLPPLRDRREDIPLLIEHFLGLERVSEKPPIIPAKIMETLYNHDWPGNIRELQNVLHRYMTLKQLDLGKGYEPHPHVDEDVILVNLGRENIKLGHTISNFEKIVIERALKKAQWNRGQTATILGVDRKTLFRKMKAFGLA